MHVSISLNLYINADKDVIDRLAQEENKVRYIRDLVLKEAIMPKERPFKQKSDKSLRGTEHIILQFSLLDERSIKFIEGKNKREVILQLIREDM